MARGQKSPFPLPGKIAGAFRRIRAYSGRKDAGKDDGETGALPDFLVIGAQKCGTSSLYQLLRRHPDVEWATKKEVHYFDVNFDEGVEWYRSHFPILSGRRKLVTGEASPYYLFHPRAAERASEVVPDARLISMLRNPVDRAYSHYQARTKRGQESLSFEEALEEDLSMLERDPVHRRSSYLERGIYVDQLRNWHEFFGRDRMLVLKSEEFFTDSHRSLGRILNFLELPSWEPPSIEARNKGKYEEPMNPGTRRWLEQYYEPHNHRLYDYLGIDFGW